ncbi:hypothetical protein NDU88_000191 [Pleurodeles waltl]|uniref:Uncharacterized protein n=1 Tax=Pleurodeles waltl TaxID=8319 RepID=A0AAV7MHY1_PLEWA|nr:hypothetical protein NDU88_000191 [Pleurodeles waltl]
MSGPDVTKPGSESQHPLQSRVTRTLSSAQKWESVDVSVLGSDSGPHRDVDESAEPRGFLAQSEETGWVTEALTVRCVRRGSWKAQLIAPFRDLKADETMGRRGWGGPHFTRTEIPSVLQGSLRNVLLPPLHSVQSKNPASQGCSDPPTSVRGIRGCHTYGSPGAEGGGAIKRCPAPPRDW